MVIPGGNACQCLGVSGKGEAYARGPQGEKGGGSQVQRGLLQHVRWGMHLVSCVLS